MNRYHCLPLARAARMAMPPADAKSAAPAIKEIPIHVCLCIDIDNYKKI